MYIQVLKLTRWVMHAHSFQVLLQWGSQIWSPLPAFHIVARLLCQSCVQVIVNFHAEFDHYLITGLRIILGVCNLKKNLIMNQCLRMNAVQLKINVWSTYSNET